MWIVCGFLFLCLGIPLFLVRRKLWMWLLGIGKRFKISHSQDVIDIDNQVINTQTELSRPLGDDQQIHSENREYISDSKDKDIISQQDNRILQINYSSKEQILRDINESKSEVMVLVIDCREHSVEFPEKRVSLFNEFLATDDFFSALKNKDNIFLVDVALETNITLNDETSIKNKLHNVDKHLIIQCGTLVGSTKVYVKEPQKDLVVLDLNSPAEKQFTFHELLEMLRNKDNFGIPLIVEALKLGLIGDFCDKPDYHRDITSVTGITKAKLDNGNIFQTISEEEAVEACTLIDYAVFHNDFLSTCLLALHYWDLFAMQDEELSTLEIAAKYADSNILAVLLKVQLLATSDLLKPNKYFNENTPLLTAAKSGKFDNVEFLIQCGVDINHCNNLGKTAIDLAWEHKHYKVVKLLLQKGVVIPKEFSLIMLEENDDAIKLRTFIEEKNALHSLIEEGDLEKVKDLVAGSSTSNLYLNVQGESALCTAIKNEKWEIYAFLKFKGMSFKDEIEEKIIQKLSSDKKDTLKQTLIPYFPQIDDSHIIYLLSKTRSGNPIDEKFKDKVHNFYLNLDKIPEISTVLKVIQYSDYLDIIVDFKKDNTSGANPTTHKESKGTTDYKNGRIYLGAEVLETATGDELENNKADVLGTFAHEFTHLAMQIVYKNDCNPYIDSDLYKLDNNEIIFKNITESILKELTGKDIDIKKFNDAIEDVMKSDNIINKNEMDEIIKRVFTSYTKEPECWPSELIVRVPHMLAKYSNEEGAQKLKDQVPKLFSYFKENVVPSFNKFVQENVLIKPRNTVQLLNHSIGIERSILESEIKFNNVINFKDFLIAKDKQILVLSTLNTWLSCINVYQALQEVPPDSYIFCKFERYIKNHTEIEKALNSKACNLLLVESFTSSDKRELQTILNTLLDLVTNRKKKVIFILHKDKVVQFTKIIKTNKYVIKFFLENDYTLNDLTDESQRKILERTVMFQDRKVYLKDLINKDLKKVINSEILVKFLNNEEVTIGHALTSLGEIDDYYMCRTFNYQIEVETKIFQDETNNDLLAVSNIDETSLIEIVQNRSKIRMFQKPEPDRSNPIKCILLDDDEEQEGAQFQSLCKQYSDLNIHLLRNESGKILWQQSRGSISKLRKYIIKNESAFFSEIELLSQINKNKVVIISNTAGMGKSTMLTNLATEIKESDPSLWLVRIDLNNYTMQLKAEKKKFGLKAQIGDKTIDKMAIQFLAKDLFRLSTPLELVLFKHYCHKIIVMFDGFDEISPDYREFVYYLMQVLNGKIKQLWVTTRPNEKVRLENELKQFSFALNPISKSDQINFLYNFWLKKLNIPEVDKELCKIYATALIELLVKVTSNNYPEFTGIPLHLKMLADVFQQSKKYPQILDEAEGWQGCEEFLASANDNNKPMLPEKLDLLSLYKHFVKKKFYDFHWEGKKKVDFSKPGLHDFNDIYKKFKKMHQTLAMYALLSDEDFNKIASEEEKQKVVSGMKNINDSTENQGIIDEIVHNKPHFIHLTFAEYFASSLLIKKMFVDPTTVFNCINNIMINTSPVFIISIIKELDKKPEERDKLLEGKTLLNFMAQKGHLNWVMTLLEADYVSYPNPDNLNKTPLHYAAEYGHSDIVKYLLSYYNDILEDNILEHGCFRNEEYALSKLVKFVNERDNNDNAAVYFAAKNKFWDIACDLLLKGAESNALKECINPVILYITEITHRSYANQDNKLRPIVEKLLIQVSDAVADFSENYDYPRLLSYFFVHGRTNVIKALMNSVNEEKRKRLLNAEDNGYTPLDRVNCSDELNDGSRLQITLYLLENGGTKTKHNIGNNSGNESSERHSSHNKTHIKNILQAAAKYGHLMTFKHFIDQENYNNYNLHLYTALQCGQINIIKYLKERHGKRIKHEGNTALHAAVDSGASLKIIKYVINNVEINAQNDEGKTPIFMAVYAKRRLNVIKYLVNHGADISIPDNSRNIPLFYAIKENQENVVNYFLLQYEVNIDLIADALMKNQVEYYQNGDSYDINCVLQNGLPRLHHSIQQNNLKWSEFLIHHGADVNMKDQEGKTPLHWASKLQQTEIVELLLQYGAIYDEIDLNNNTPLNLLFLSVSNLRETKVVWLLKMLNKLFNSGNLMQHLMEIADPQNQCVEWGPYGSGFPKAYENNNPMIFILNAQNTKKKTLLHIAADTNLEHAINMFLKFNHDYLEEKDLQNQHCKYYQSISINSFDFQGNTPLHLASQKGYAKIVSLLLDEGAMLNIKNNQGQTPEMLAYNNHHKNVTKLLQLAKHLFIFIKQNSLEQVKECVHLGAHVNAKDENGNTPLHAASIFCDQSIILFLLQNNANMEAVNIDNLTPLLFATKSDKIENIKLLLSKGAIFNDQDKVAFNLWENGSASLLKAIDKLFNDIHSDNPEKIIDYLRIIQTDYEIDIKTIINIRDNQGNTIFHYAAEENCLTTIKFLSKNGAFYNAENKFNKTAEILAYHSDIKDLLKVIKELFHELNIFSKEAKKVDVQIITNVCNDQGMTLLHVAAYFDNLEVVKWLVEQGANIYAMDNNDKTVLDYVDELYENKTAIFDYLHNVKT